MMTEKQERNYEEPDDYPAAKSHKFSAFNELRYRFPTYFRRGLIVGFFYGILYTVHLWWK